MYLPLEPVVALYMKRMDFAHCFSTKECLGAEGFKNKCFKYLLYLIYYLLYTNDLYKLQNFNLFTLMSYKF